MQKVLLILVFTAVCLGADTVSAQGYRNYRDPTANRVVRTDVLHSVATRSKVRAAKAQDPVLEADKFWRSHGRAYGFKNALTDLTPLRADSDSATKMTHVRYGQYYKGVPVVGADAVVHLGRDGLVQTVNGQLAGWVKPKERRVHLLTKKQAVAKAQAIFKVENNQSGVPDAAITMAVIAPGLLKHTPETTAYLTWAVGLSTPLEIGPDASAVYYIDIHDGTLRYRKERVLGLTRRIGDCTANPSSGNCYSNYVDPVSGYHYGRREGDPSWGPNPVFNSNDVDIVYDTFGAAHSYLQTKFNRNGANGRGELGNASYPYTAANVYLDVLPGWDGKDCTTASYRRDAGYVRLCHRMTVPDVTAHEYAHGLSFAIRQMDYWGETGALEESFSDVFGELIEEMVVGRKDWLNGTGVFYPGQEEMGMRNLADPPNSPIIPFADRNYSPMRHCDDDDNGGVHLNSTILSHGAYLMAVGTVLGTPFNGCSIKPIGTEKLEQIMYRVNLHYYTAAATFHEAYLDWNKACADLYGSLSETCDTVRRALQAVELDQPGSCSKTERVPPACQDKCTDSDQGILSEQYGETTSLLTGEIRKDFCMFGGTSVSEYYCDGDSIAGTIVKCAKGCDWGAGACRG